MANQSRQLRARLTVAVTLGVALGCSTPSQKNALRPPADAAATSATAPQTATQSPSTSSTAAFSSAATDQRREPAEESLPRVVTVGLMDVSGGAPGPSGAASQIHADVPHAGVERLPSFEPLPPPAPPGASGALNEEQGRRRPIDLPTALRLADARNPFVAYTREQVRQAYARLERADALWLPSLRAGANFNRHEGAIQDVAGVQFPTSRGAFYGGLGAGGFGAGSPLVPGVWANFHVADMIFQPLAAEQAIGARRGAVGVALNDTLLRVANGYLELLRAEQELAIALETRQHAQKLYDVCAAYARTGQGLVSDADRAATELSLRNNNVVRAEESIAVASARLAQLLRLDPTAQFEPIEPTVTPLHLVAIDQGVGDLIAEGLSSRPELVESRYLVREAVTRYKRERFAPLIPSVLLGVSMGAMSAGEATNFAGGQGRLDLDAITYWELRNLGYGDEAARRDTASTVRQNRWRQVELMDLVAREVTEAHVQVRARQQQIAIAEQGVRVASHSYELNARRIDQAQGLPIEALQSLQAMDQARREYLRAVIDYNLAQFALVRALGWPDP